MACVSDDMTELVRIFANGMVPKNGISILPTALLPIEFRMGDIKGPFHINDNPSTSYTPLTLIDQFGKTHSFEIIEKDPILSRIHACADPHAANAVAYVLDKIVQLVITKDIRQTETIFAAFLTTPSINLADITSGNSICSFNDKITDGGSEKRYPCTHCGLAKFNSFENLAVHQQKYCKKAENNRLSTAMLKSPSITPMNSLSQTIIPSLQSSLTTPSTSSLLLPLGLTNPMQSQNIVLLPIAQHNQPQSDLIHFLGPPQTIIPIAIGKQSFTTSSLVLQKPFCASIKTPPSINFSNDGLNVTVPLVQIDTPCSSSASIIGTTLPATVNPIPDAAPSTSTVFNTLNITTSNPSIKRAHDGSSLSPMEISKRARHDSIAEATNKALASHGQSFFAKAGTSTEGEKPYVCSCGVTFSAMNTLKAHRTLYCKDVGRPDDHREPTRKLPSRCSQCSYEPQSISQLSLHIRNVHNDVQAYVCKECGYRGYSIRGIRGHMKTHPELECMKLDALLASYVTEIKGNDNNPSSETEVIVT